MQKNFSFNKTNFNPCAACPNALNCHLIESREEVKNICCRRFKEAKNDQATKNGWERMLKMPLPYYPN